MKMKELKKIQLIESPKKEISLGDDSMSALLGGSNYYCKGKYTSSTIGANHCIGSYSSGSCGDAGSYCNNYSDCIWMYNN
jgi:hypothetical protein